MIEMKTHEIRYKWSLTQNELHEITGIPLRTIQGWDLKDTMPVYMAKLLDCTIKEEKRHGVQIKNEQKH